tara:strand:- start:533 stop:1522 length:990 start_codon:yes stop_codon:yes gene_type:complete
LIISRTPYRISFFGGGTDYPEWYLKHTGEVISTTIDKYLYISCRNLPSFYEYKYRVIWNKMELAKKRGDIEHKVVKKMIDHFKIKEGLDIVYAGDLPAQSGMGSSSSFVVGLMAALYELKKIKFNKKKLATDSMFFEQKILKEVVGSQDQVATVYGGFQSIKFMKDGSFKIINLVKDANYLKTLSKRLILVYTERKKNAGFIANKYVSILDKKQEFMEQISKYTNEAKKIIKEKELDEFGLLLNKTWEAKKRLSPHISNSEIDNIFKKAEKLGALGGKLLGAGGGGFILFYVPLKKRNTFINSFKKEQIVDFNFANKGSEIILNSYNNK